MGNKPESNLEKLKRKIGGAIHTDGELYELYFGPPRREIYISENRVGFYLASKRPLYVSKSGKCRLVRRRSNGWFEATVASSEVEDSILRSVGGSDSEVSYENIVEDYCRRNPSTIEDGMTIYRKGSLRGVQLPADGRFIDILGVASNGDFVVIEFKRSSADDKVLGQISYYMSWVRDNLAKPAQCVRGIIIGYRITKQLRLAAKQNPNIELRRYRVKIDFPTIS
jgi:RecB family endonuclease NucS